MGLNVQAKAPVLEAKPLENVVLDIAKTPETNQQLAEIVNSLQGSIEKMANALQQIADQAAPKKAPPPSFAQKYHLRKIAFAVAAAAIAYSYSQTVQDLIRTSLNFSGVALQAAKETPAAADAVLTAASYLHTAAYVIGMPIATVRNMLPGASPLTTESQIAGLGAFFGGGVWVLGKSVQALSSVVSSIASPIVTVASPVANLAMMTANAASGVVFGAGAVAAPVAAGAAAAPAIVEAAVPAAASFGATYIPAFAVTAAKSAATTLAVFATAAKKTGPFVRPAIGTFPFAFMLYHVLGNR